MKAVRQDIQLLRAIAVLAVVLYHAGFLPAGYLGVDVFFVISGYLIAGVLQRDALAGRLHYGDFLMRRAMRLLPAAYVVMLITACLAPFFLASREMSDFRQQIASAFTFSANFTLAGQQGYFDGAADTKPFLHLWSLAVEWQYYFLLPFLFMLPLRALPALAVIFLGSLVLGVLFVDSEMTFYLLPTRAWELALGSLGALLPGIRLRHRGIVFGSGLLVLGCLFCVELTRFRPGPEALLACAVTLMLILLNHDYRAQGIVGRSAQRMGDASYAIYLVHWPIFSFYSNLLAASSTEPPHDELIRVGLMLLSVLLAFLLHDHVETRYRYVRFSRWSQGIKKIGILTLILLAASLLITWPSASENSFADRRSPAAGLTDSCRNFPSVSTPDCSGIKPEILLWGDSFAMHLLDGLMTAGEPDIVQATKPFCGPFPGVAGLGKGADWAVSCLDFNEAVQGYLAKTPSIRTVVLSGRIDNVLGEANEVLVRRHGVSFTEPAASGEAMRKLAGLVASLNRKGIKVVFFTPPPGTSFDASLCFERVSRGLWSLGTDPACAISVADYRAVKADRVRFIEQLDTIPDLEVVRLDRYLCDETRCITRINDTMLYRDASHLSREGSKLLGQRMRWPDHLAPH